MNMTVGETSLVCLYKKMKKKKVWSRSLSAKTIMYVDKWVRRLNDKILNGQTNDTLV